MSAPALSKSVRRVRSIGIACAILGPISLLLALLMVAVGELVTYAVDKHLITPTMILPDVSRMLRFSELSAWVIAPLSFATLVVAVRALRNLARGRFALLVLGWTWVAGFVLLAALWEGIASGDGADLSTHLSGAAMNLIQAAVIVPVCLFLARDDVKAECDALEAAPK